MTIIFNPFEKYSEKKLLIVGIIALIVSVFLANVLNLKFDGVIDIHVTSGISYATILKQLLIDVSVITLLLYIAGIIYNRKTRFIDILSSVIIARIPFIILILTNINDFNTNLSEKITKSMLDKNIESVLNENLISILLISLLTISILIWVIVLLFNGYKIATNCKGTKPIILFVIALFLAEVISKLLIYKFL